jgi:hypothetical protein
MTVDKTNDFQSKIKNRKIQFKRILRIFTGMEYQGNVGMFDNVLFDNYLDLVRQFKNRSFLGFFFLPVTGINKN